MEEHITVDDNPEDGHSSLNTVLFELENLIFPNHDFSPSSSQATISSTINHPDALITAPPSSLELRQNNPQDCQNLINASVDRATVEISRTIIRLNATFSQQLQQASIDMTNGIKSAQNSATSTISIVVQSASSATSSAFFSVTLANKAVTSANFALTQAQLNVSTISSASSSDVSRLSASLALLQASITSIEGSASSAIAAAQSALVSATGSAAAQASSILASAASGSQGTPQTVPVTPSTKNQGTILLTPGQVAAIVAGTVALSIFLSFAIYFLVAKAKRRKERDSYLDEKASITPREVPTRLSSTARTGNGIIIKFNPPKSPRAPTNRKLGPRRPKDFPVGSSFSSKKCSRNVTLASDFSRGTPPSLVTTAGPLTLDFAEDSGVFRSYNASPSPRIVTQPMEAYNAGTTRHPPQPREAAQIRGDVDRMGVTTTIRYSPPPSGQREPFIKLNPAERIANWIQTTPASNLSPAESTFRETIPDPQAVNPFNDPVEEPIIARVSTGFFSKQFNLPPTTEDPEDYERYMDSFEEPAPIFVDDFSVHSSEQPLEQHSPGLPMMKRAYTGPDVDQPFIFPFKPASPISFKQPTENPFEQESVQDEISTPVQSLHEGLHLEPLEEQQPPQSMGKSVGWEAEKHDDIATPSESAHDEEPGEPFGHPIQSHDSEPLQTFIELPISRPNDQPLEDPPETLVEPAPPPQIARVTSSEIYELLRDDEQLRSSKMPEIDRLIRIVAEQNGVAEEPLFWSDFRAPDPEIERAVSLLIQKQDSIQKAVSPTRGNSEVPAGMERIDELVTPPSPKLAIDIAAVGPKAQAPAENKTMSEFPTQSDTSQPRESSRFQDTAARVPGSKTNSDLKEPATNEEAEDRGLRGRSMQRTSDIIEARLSIILMVKEEEDRLEKAVDEYEKVTSPLRRNPVTPNTSFPDLRLDRTKSPLRRNPTNIPRPSSPPPFPTANLRSTSVPPQPTIELSASPASKRSFSQTLSKFQTMAAQNPTDLKASNTVTERAIAGIHIPSSLREQAVRNLSRSRSRGPFSMGFEAASRSASQPGFQR